MKKAVKILYVVLAAILVLVIVAVAAIELSANSILKVAIETAATKALNVGVSLKSLDLSILKGQISLEGLLIKNPPGYQHDKLLELRAARVQVDITSLLSDTVKIKEIMFDGMDLTLEQKGISGNNLQDVINALPGGEKKAAPEQQPAGKKLLIKTLEISNTTVNVKLLPVPGKSDTVTLKLPNIRLTDLGGDKKMDIVALTNKVLTTITESIAKEGANVLPADMTNAMKATLDKTKELGQAISGEGKKLLDTGKGLGKGITDGLKGLLKPKDE